MFLSPVFITFNTMYIYFHKPCLLCTTPVCVGIKTSTQLSEAGGEHASNPDTAIPVAGSRSDTSPTSPQLAASFCL
jgi:hypothetical protein